MKIARVPPPQIGSLCMDIIDGELQRADQLREQLANKRQRSSSKALNADGRDEDAPLTGSLEKTHSKYQAVLDKQDRVIILL